MSNPLKQLIAPLCLALSHITLKQLCVLSLPPFKSACTCASAPTPAVHVLSPHSSHLLPHLPGVDLVACFLHAELPAEGEGVAPAGMCVREVSDFRG